MFNRKLIILYLANIVDEMDTLGIWNVHKMTT